MVGCEREAARTAGDKIRDLNASGVRGAARSRRSRSGRPDGPARSRVREEFRRSFPSMTTSFRTERDSMGELSVPADALWGAQTQRAVQNFPISGLTMPREFIAALGLIKQAAARANTRLDLLKSDVRKPLTARPRERRGRKAQRAVPHRRLPDGLGHQHEHERQRGHRAPGDDAPRSRRASERRRQHGPEQQRRHPDHHSRERGAGGAERPAARAQAGSRCRCARRRRKSARS